MKKEQGQGQIPDRSSFDFIWRILCFLYGLFLPVTNKLIPTLVLLRATLKAASTPQQGVNKLREASRFILPSSASSATNLLLAVVLWDVF